MDDPIFRFINANDELRRYMREHGFHGETHNSPSYARPRDQNYAKPKDSRDILREKHIGKHVFVAPNRKRNLIYGQLVHVFDTFETGRGRHAVQNSPAYGVRTSKGVYVIDINRDSVGLADGENFDTQLQTGQAKLKL